MPIVPWGDEDARLLAALLGDPAMMAHLGGPETPEQIADRQARYVAPGSGAFKVVDPASGTGVGFVGFWEREWRGTQVYELGWSILPAYQGRGLAADAAREALELARTDGRHRFAHAFPGEDNAPSNAICRKLGFVLLGACDVEYPPGHRMRCNDWRLVLRAER